MATHKNKSRRSSAPKQDLIKGLRRINSQLPLVGLSGDPRKWSKAKQLRIYNKYKDVATGKAQAIKLSKTMAAQYEAAGLKSVKVITNRYAVVPMAPGFTRLEIEQGNPLLQGMIKQVRALASGEVEIVILPYRLDKISDFIKQCHAHPQWNKLKKDAEKFRFGFGDGSIDGTNWNGNRWGRLEDIADYLQGYEQIKNGPSSKVDRSLMSALQIVRVRGVTDIDARVAEQQDHKRQRSIARAKKNYAKLKKERGG